MHCVTLGCCLCRPPLQLALLGEHTAAQQQHRVCGQHRPEHALNPARSAPAQSTPLSLPLTAPSPASQTACPRPLPPPHPALHLADCRSAPRPSELPRQAEALFQLLDGLEQLCEDRIARGLEREPAAQVQAILRYRLTRLVSS
jgi:hypothetical protein